MNNKVSDYREKFNSMLSTSRNKTYFVAAVTVAFVLLLALAGIAPSIGSLTLQIEENRKRDELIGKLNAKLSTLKNLTREYNQKTSLIEYFNQIFPNKLYQERIITKLADLFEDNNLSFENITFLDVSAEQNKFKETVGKQIVFEKFQIDGEGTQQNILNLIEEIDSERRIMNTKNIVMARKTDDELSAGIGAGDYRFSFQIEVYYTDESVNK
jgi:hypothetical protein